MYDAPSEARNATASATSSGVPMRPAGSERSKAARRISSRRIQSAIGVSISPGQTQLTRTPRGPQSIARLRVNITTAPFDAL